ncbi:MAG: Ig-like domain-containing protein [Oscillospiraceae bacterium]|nr:Ig-like domain-containing protein [Oscillospiraceae bacterium]
MKKKVLSLIVAMTLVFTLVPASVSAADTKLVYDMVYEGATDGASIEAIDYSDTNDTWKFGGKKAAATITSNMKGHGTNAFLAVNEWWAVTLKVPTAGTYNLSINHSVGSVSGDVAVYFGSATNTPETIVASSDAVKTVSFYADSSTTKGTTTPIGSVIVPAAGEYTVVFKAVANGAGGKSRQYIKQVILDYTGEAPEEPDIEDIGINIVYSTEVASVAGNATMENVNYTDTFGFWEFAGKHANATITRNAAAHGLNAYVQSPHWWAMKVYVPVAGSYTLKLNHSMGKDCGITAIFFDDAAKTPAQVMEGTPVNTVDFYKDQNTTPGTTSTIAVVEVPEAGEYMVAFKTMGKNESATYARHYIKQVILDGGSGSVPMIDISSSTDKIMVGETATVTATSTYMSDRTTVTNTTITYSVAKADEGIAEVSANGVVTGLSEGKAKIIATATNGSILSTKSLFITVKKAEPGNVVEDTVVNFKASAYEGGSVSNANVQEVTMGTDVTVSATANEGYTFAYWKNSAGVVLSTKAEETFKVNTNTAVIAVFDKAPTDDAIPVYFYNGNGMPLGDTSVAKDTTFGDAKLSANIGTPSLTGFAFDKWSVDDNELITTLTRAVAIYKDDETKTYTVKNGATTVASGLKYGESVTVNGSDDFTAWKLGDKVISYEKNFTFDVYGNITLTEATEAIEKAPVLVLDKADGNYFLTYDEGEFELIEAGILFGSNGVTIGSVDGYKTVAKRGTGQFTALPHEGATASTIARGYLIFKKDGVIRVIYAD